MSLRVARDGPYAGGVFRYLWLSASLGLLALAAGCGGGETAGTETGAVVSAPPWAAELLREPGPEGAALLAGTDFAVGRNRVKFLLVRDNGSLVQAPVADVVHRPDPEAAPVRTTARLESFGVSAAPGEHPRSFYVAELELPHPGKAWLVIHPRGVAYQGFQLLDVRQQSQAVGLGERAPASANPTVATRPAREITTARPPDTALLQHTVADSLEQRLPFVVAFATPAFCRSRTCGPTVQVVEQVRRRYKGRGIRFIHVEIYENNLPGNGVNPWVREWKLPSEPWVFVVGRDGRVRDRFEGAVSVNELDASVRRYLLG